MMAVCLKERDVNMEPNLHTILGYLMMKDFEAREYLSRGFFCFLPLSDTHCYLRLTTHDDNPVVTDWDIITSPEVLKKTYLRKHLTFTKRKI